MNEFKIKIPDKNLFLSFCADANALRYFQNMYKNMPDGQGNDTSNGIEEYMKGCKARQNFIIIATDATDGLVTLDALKKAEFLTNDDMEIP